MDGDDTSGHTCSFEFPPPQGSELHGWTVDKVTEGEDVGDDSNKYGFEVTLTKPSDGKSDTQDQRVQVFTVEFRDSTLFTAETSQDENNKVWRCGRRTLGENDRCVFHRNEHHLSDQALSQVFLRVVNGGSVTEYADVTDPPDDLWCVPRDDSSENGVLDDPDARKRLNKQFVGSSFEKFELTYERLSGDDMYPIDLRGATFKSFNWNDSLVQHELRLEGTHVEGSITFDNSEVQANISYEEAIVGGGVWLSRATVDGNVSLFGATVGEGVSLKKATVDGGVSLKKATVDGGVSLFGATVDGGVSLFGATVDGDVSLDGATVGGRVWIDGATIDGDVLIDGPTVDGKVLLNDAIVDGRVWIDGATVDGGVWLSGATVGEGVSLSRTTVDGRVWLKKATVDGGVSLNDATVNGDVSLDEITVIGPVTLTDAEIRENIDIGLQRSEKVYLSEITVDGNCTIKPPDESNTNGIFGPILLESATIKGTTEIHSTAYTQLRSAGDDSTQTFYELRSISLQRGTFADIEFIPGNKDGIGTILDLREATVGKLNIKNTNLPYRHALLFDTTFDEFEFSKKRNRFREIDWTIHEPRKDAADRHTEGSSGYRDVAMIAPIEDDDDTENRIFENARDHADDLVSGMAQQKDLAQMISDREELTTSLFEFDLDKEQEPDIDTKLNWELSDERQFFYTHERYPEKATTARKPFEITTGFRSLFERSYGRFTSSDTEIRDVSKTFVGNETDDNVGEVGPNIKRIAELMTDDKVARAAYINSPADQLALNRVIALQDAFSIGRQSSALLAVEAARELAQSNNLVAEIPTGFDNRLQDKHQFVDRVAQRIYERHDTLVKLAKLDDMPDNNAEIIDIIYNKFREAWLPVIQLAETIQETRVDIDEDDEEIKAHGGTRQTMDLPTETPNQRVPSPIADAIIDGLAEWSPGDSIETELRENYHAAERIEAAEYRLSIALARQEAAHRLGSLGVMPTYDQLESTYVKAKNAAHEIGDSTAAGEFFLKEKEFARRQHEAKALGIELSTESEANTTPSSAPSSLSGQLGQTLSRVWQRTKQIKTWLGAEVLRGLMGYGERPFRVVGWSVLSVFLFAGIFAFMDVMNGSATPIYKSFGWSEPNSGVEIVLSYLLLSLQSFITLVLSSITDVRPPVRFVAQIEGFIGAFMVAVLVFALTRAIHR